MTLAAKRGYIDHSRAPEITLAWIFGSDFVGLRWIAAVTIVARQSSRKMNIVFDRACRIADLSLKLNVAFDTRTLLLRVRGKTHKQNERAHREQQFQVLCMHHLAPQAR
jgi:hypothetical protein